MIQTLLAKLAAATLILTAMLHQLQPSLGGLPTAKDTTTASIDLEQASYFLQYGKYEHIKETAYEKGVYEVNELLYPNQTRGYEVIFREKELVEMASGTTPIITTTRYEKSL